MSSSPTRCILFEGIGDERKFMMPMLRILKEQQGARLIGLVRFAQDIKPLLDTGLFEAVYATADMLDHLPPDDDSLIPAAREIEQRFDTVFHYNLADRRLYFTGCTSFPYTTIETSLPYREWIRQFVAMYHAIEAIMRRHEVTLAMNGRRVVCDVARGLGIPNRCLGYSFLHDRMIWKDGMKVNGEWLLAAHHRMRARGDRLSSDMLEPPPFHMDIRRRFFAGISLRVLIKTTILIFLRTAYWRLRRYDKVTRFGYSGWRHIRFHFKRRSVFRHLVRKSITAEELEKAGHPYVFMPLQMEPEVLLSGQTPEFYDQIAMIHQVAKELPVGTYLAIKDHVPALGYRDLSFYRMLDTMPNVLLIDPREFAIPLIRRARAVVSLLGRSAFEAAAFGVPVLAYSPGLYFGHLPHVDVATDLAHTGKVLHRLIGYTDEERAAFAREGEFLLAAMHDSTIDPAEYNKQEELGAALLASLDATFDAEAVTMPNPHDAPVAPTGEAGHA
ncbi:MAG: hypothetical protein VW644_00215 [Alphaproteobacteria bacterium]|jgi:hypothetical protein